MKFYEEKNVLPSISGHLHCGLAPVRKNGVEYFTAAALWEEPFRYTVIHLEGRSLSYAFSSL